MKKVLFVINTEGHLLSTASLVFDTFNEVNGYEPFVLQVGLTGNSRFKNPIRKEVLSSNYYEIDPNSKTLKKELKELLETEFERVFIFLEQLKLNVFFADYFKRKGSIICLGPDGNKPYFTVDKLAPRSRITGTINAYQFFRKHKFEYKRLYFLSWNYGRLKPLDEIWVTYPESFNNRTNKKIVGFNILNNQPCIAKTNMLFNFDSKTIQFENIIFYVSNILYKDYVYEAEIEAIKYIIKKYPDKPVYIKYHPSTPSKQIDAFRRLGVNIFKSSIPAELYVSVLQESIIVSGWSAALMIDNPTCKFYWLNKYFKSQGAMIDYINLSNPTKHIIEVEDLDQIES